MTAPPSWDALFSDPDPLAIAKLSKDDFAAFVTYVFQRAGFTVIPYERDEDVLELKDERETVALVGISGNVHHVGHGPVDKLVQLPGKRGGMKYFVASDGFDNYAKTLEERTRNLLLIDRPMLLRYIRYIHGTRHPKAKTKPIGPDLLFEDAPQKRPRRQTKVLALANNKGGVCKTTSVLVLAMLLGEECQKRVLVVDMDDQANLTQACLGDPPADANLSDYFVDACALSQTIRPTRFPNVWIVPSHPNLRLTYTNLTDWTNVERKFTYDLHDAKMAIPFTGNDFDWILIDTPPSLSIYTRAALAAAHYVLVPITPSVFGGQGITNLADALRDIRNLSSITDQTEFLGCFVTRWRSIEGTQRDAARLLFVAQQGGIPWLGNGLEIEEDANFMRRLVSPDTKRDARSMHGAVDSYRRLLQEVRNIANDY